MKNFALTLALVAAGFTSVSAMAADQATVNSSATVISTCNFIDKTAELNFGELDPSSQLDKDATASLKYQCTKGTQSTVVLNSGSNLNNLSNADSTSSIKQTLATTGGNQVGEGYGVPLTYNIAGKIAYADYATAKGGLHSSTMFVTITP